jgi:tetratricopeptide (TPR) repeat protein
VSYEAYREFAAAFGALGFDSEALLAHLERAVEIDPEFWMARLRLGMVYTTLDRTDEAEAQFAEVRKSSARLNPAELRALEFFDARRSGRRLEALQIARRIHDDEPRDRVFGLVAANTALAANRPREALALLGPLSDFDRAEMGRWPQGSFFIRCSALAHHFLGEYEAELDDVRLGLEHYPGLVSIREDQARTLAALGRVDEVEATVEESLTLPIRASASAGTVMLEASEELRAHGHPVAAVRVAERAAEWYADRPAGDTEGIYSSANQAEILWMAERYEEAREAADAFARESPRNVHANGLRGVMAARAGDLGTADDCDHALAAEQRPMRKG